MTSRGFPTLRRLAAAHAMLKHRGTYLLAGVGILGLDLLSGPDLMFPILFVIPVGLSAWHLTDRFAYLLALALSALHVFAAIGAEPSLGILVHCANGATRFVVLALLAYFVARTVRQRAKITILEGLLPICMHCKRIRGQGPQWHQLEEYISQHSSAQFSHGICPECLSTHYPAEDGVRPAP